MKLLRPLLFIVLLFGCKGTIKTTTNVSSDHLSGFQKAYIMSTENSQFIRFRFGIITPYAYIPLPDKPAETTEVIGNTAEVIKASLLEHGVVSVIGNRGDSVDGYDFIVQYNDIWRWDFKKVLDHLDIAFISADGDSLLAYSSYDIYHNKEMHNFPSPKKEVPKMIEQMLGK